MELDLKKLNKEQKEAVVHGQGPLLIVAGAGTGKTTVITQRIAYLIEKGAKPASAESYGEVKPEEILAVTFTDKAAEEMEERVDKLLPYGYVDLWISTFHAFCERILKDNGLDIGLPNDFKILDNTAGWLLVYRNLDKFKLDYYKPLGNPTKFIQFLISHFSRCKDQGIYPEDYLEYSEGLKTRDDVPEDDETERIKEVANAFHIYQRLLLENSSLDFGDLINYCLKLFKKRPLILKKYREKFKYILVDEFQDTNWAQYELIKILAAPRNNLTVTADDDQCLPGDSKIDFLEKGKIMSKKIKNIKAGDKVLTAVGKGHIGVAKVDNVFINNKKAQILTVKTENGYSIKVTDNHKMFCCVPRTARQGYHYVYLMFRKDLGWRIGVTDDLILRLRLERSADKILAVKAFNSDTEARYYETLWSLKYGIPTNCFKNRKRIVIKDSWVVKLYKEIDVANNVQKLSQDLNIDLDSPHYCLNAVKRGRSTRIIINLQMCHRNYRSKVHVRSGKTLFLNGLIRHRLYLETSDKQTIKKLETAGYILHKTKKGMKLNIEGDNVKDLEEKARIIEKITDGFIEYKFNVASKYSKPSSTARNYMSLIMPAKNLVLGHYLPVKKGAEIIYDKIISIKEADKKIKVYDLEIKGTHNFIANGIVVHNSIYRWRGASFTNIVNFKKDFPKAKQVSLVKNYRSTQNILDQAYKFIKANDPDRLEYVNKIDKKLVAEKKGKGIIEHIHAKTLDEEVRKTIGRILEILKKDKKANYNDFAILVRANNSANPFIRALERAGLPYQFLASRGLYAKPVILDIVSYFKLLDNYHESSAVYRILNMPFLGIPVQDIMKLTQYVSRKTKSLYEAMEELPLISGISEKAQEKIVFILGLIKRHSALARRKTVSELMAAFLEGSGYLKHLVKNSPAGEDKEQLDLLNQFYKRVKNFEEAAIEPTLNNFMKEINLELESGEEGKLEFDPEQGPDMVKVMTIHGAKGLEFKYVFLVSMVDKRFPCIERREPIELPENLIKDIKPAGDVHLLEERRLCYVAMTRAKKELYFTSAEDYGGVRKKRLSRFLIEMGYKDNFQFSISNFQTNELLELKHKILNTKYKIQANYLPEHFSFSQLAAFEKCPLQYKFAFILKIPIKGKAVFSFGKTMHGALFNFLKQANESNKQEQENLFGFKDAESGANKKGSNSGLESLSELYEKNWLGEWYENKEQKEKYYKLGKRIIKDFYEEFSKNPPKILKINQELALEMPFNLKIGEHTLKGRIDRIDEKDGGATIIDYKTGNSKEKLAMDDKEQLLIYQLAAEEVFKIKPKELIYYYLNDGKKASFLGTEKELKKQKEKIIREIEEIKNSNFKPTPGWQCGFCDFKDICDFAER
ncbi:MAG: CRISPR-associated protein Cas4 [Candidatus Nealsonbacteria bacterium CG08_land_8_20_14_0_20_38_20]|uniref:CRISPR-associated protein Cas4 n=1 Tax=Candidatus Nealsonbacteria bacterium CG08_land_8_20_14_0_20_38_20 TaxID=1974705 RepID=A0A2H0YM99_9BACT|nr:MAG: CRISPR-associated protein Cas4 [Candidatus Nealsonbacteria bacterium CG08_land_8_20_14_0_20_38_20]